jgi:hypothetical protein
MAGPSSRPSTSLGTHKQGVDHRDEPDDDDDARRRRCHLHPISRSRTARGSSQAKGRKTEPSTRLETARGAALAYDEGDDAVSGKISCTIRPITDGAPDVSLMTKPVSVERIEVEL